jgi:hypothetical protein
MGMLKNVVAAVEKAVKEKQAADAAAAVKAKQVAAEKVVNDEAAAPIGSKSSSYSDKGSLTRYTPVTEKEIEIRSNLAGFKKGGLVARGQGAVIRKKKTARIC